MIEISIELRDIIRLCIVFGSLLLTVILMFASSRWYLDYVDPGFKRDDYDPNQKDLATE